MEADIDFLELVKALVANLFVLMGFAALCTLAGSRSVRIGKKKGACLTGLMFGAMGVVVMLTPVVMHPGYRFDSRVGVIGTAALVGGPVTGAVSLVFPILYRLHIGGSGVLAGILSIVLAYVFGLIGFFRLNRQQKAIPLRGVILWAFATGVMIDLVMLTVVTNDFLSQGVAYYGVHGVLLILLMDPLSMALLSALIVLEKHHVGAMCAVADTERRMLHSQKMAAIGQLSHKLAHSILNALTVISGNAELAKAHCNEPAKITGYVDEIVKTINSLSLLTGELVAFASPGLLQLRRMDLNKCLLGVENLLAKNIGTGIEVVVDNDLFAGEVMLDPNRIEQVILHLALNAADAMAGAGRLTIRVAPAKLSKDERARLQAGVPAKRWHHGDFSVLTVSDTGCGMTPETVSRIFEPFFTTKENRNNAGLGLSTVYNIVQVHRGFIDVRSRPQHGTTFFIYFPVVE